MIRGQWLCTTLYSGIKAGSIGCISGLRPNVVTDDGRMSKMADALLVVENSVGGGLFTSLPVHDVGDAHRKEACGRPCV